MKISETDINLLNALIDDELSADEKAKVLQRLQQEDEQQLQQMFVELDQLKNSMQASYKQSLAKRSAPHVKLKKRLNFFSLLAPVSVIGVVLAVSLYYFNVENTQQSPSLLAVHQGFSHSDYQVLERGVLKTVQFSAGQKFILPDLSQSSLYLVAQRSDANQEQLLHYRGTNGCKLTLRVQDSLQLRSLEKNREGTQQYQWVIAGQAYQVIATGMDQARFDAIANYIEKLSHSVAGIKKYQIAMQQSYQDALPCS